jgi:hypothetical protein
MEGGGGLEAGATFASDVVVVVAGELGAGDVGAEGAVVVVFGRGLTGGLDAAAVGVWAGATWLAGVARGRVALLAGVGFVCPKTGVSAARSSATEQSGRSTRFM